MNDKKVIEIEERFAEVTSLPAANGEYFWVQQVVPGDKYEPTQYAAMRGN
jgi:hypothetical protein